MTSCDVLVFHNPTTRSLRIVWLCEELGLNYELELIKDPSKDLKTDEYKQKNPNGLLPAVKIDDEFYYESGAIMEIILDKFGRGKLAPAPNTKSRGKFLQWIWFLEATFSPPLSELLHHKMLLPEDKKVKEVIPYQYGRAAQPMQTVEDQLKKTHYLLGDEFSAADIVCGHVLMVADKLKVLKPDEHPAAFRYFEEMKARPGYKKAVAG